jgi:peptide/nickel transport system substrate-binding protein
MFRGFRWQLIAFIISIILFGIGLSFRNSIVVTPPEIQTSITPTQKPTDLPTIEPTQPPVPTPFPETQIPQVAVPNETGIATYREGIVGDIKRLNPIFAHLNTVDNDITSLIFEGLMKSNDFGEPILNLAREFVTSRDGLEYVFTLRDDILWQDGQPFTADDVIYTMSLLSSPDYAQFSPMASFWKTVETQKLDTHIVRFRLTQPLGSFTSFLTIGILPEHALRGTTISDLATHPFNLSPIGTGAYQLASLRSTTGDRIDEVELVFAPVFTQRTQNQTGYPFSTLNFKLFTSTQDAIQAYENGAIDALANVTTRNNLIFLPNSRIYTQVEPDVTILLFNWEADDPAIFADRRIRQALSVGLNQQDIVERYIANEATFADSPLIPGSWAYTSNSTWSSFDQTAANGLIESANVPIPDSISGTDETTRSESSLFSFSILVEDDPTLSAIATDIAAQWGQIGFDVFVDAVDSTLYQDRVNTGDFQATITTLSIGADPDVYRYWHPGQVESGQNFGKVSNNEIAELLEIARRDNNGINRTTTYQQFQERFAEQAIAIPLYYPLYTFVARDNIEGIKLGFLGSSADRFRNIDQWRPTPTNT